MTSPEKSKPGLLARLRQKRRACKRERPTEPVLAPRIGVRVALSATRTTGEDRSGAAAADAPRHRSA